MRSTVLSFLVGISLLATLSCGPALAQTRVPSREFSSPQSDRYTLAREYYINNCGTCHLALPPEVLPSETWQKILERPQNHYGESLEPPIGPVVILMWEYLRTFSRSVLEKEPVPQFVSQSRYFQALHPGVEFSEPISHRSCNQCHPNAAQLNYRQLESAS